MDISPSETSPGDVVITLDDEELAAIEAAYIEKICGLLSEDGIDSITELDLTLSEAKSEKDVNHRVPEEFLPNIIATLGLFVEGTTERALEVARKSGKAFFKNPDIVERVKLGRRAEMMVEELGCSAVGATVKQLRALWKQDTEIHKRPAEGQ